jgi:hypothetical protein
VIVWVASYPRSGNTFLRIALHRLYGIATSTVYDVDGVAQRLGPDLVGFEARPAEVATMRDDDRLHFVKTHRPRDAAVHERDHAICLVRDGRDALVSWARQRSEPTGRTYLDELARMIVSPDGVGTGQWGTNVLSWVADRAPRRVMIRYEDLIAAPHAAVGRVMAELAPAIGPLPGAVVPSFAELHELDAQFFRRGVVGTHRDELPDGLHAQFWSQPDNATAMALLGVAR